MAVIFSGFILRVYKLGSESLWIDEGYTVMQTEAVARHGCPRLLSGNIESKDFLLPYLLAPIKKTLGNNVFFLRFISVLFGVASIIFMFLLARILFNRYFALIPSFFIAFSYWHIAWSRQIRAYSALIFFVLLIVYFVLRFEKSVKKRYLYLSFLFIFFAMLAKSSFGMLLFPSLLAYLFLKKEWRLLWSIILLAAIAVFYFKGILLDSLESGFFNYFFYYLFGYFWNHFGIFFLLAISGYYVALSWKKDLRCFHIFNLVYFLTTFIFFSFFSYIAQYRYMLVVTPLLFIYSTYFIYHFFANVFPSSNKKRILATVILLFFIFAVDCTTTKTLLFLPRSDFVLEHYTPQPDFKFAYACIREDQADGDVIISPYPYMDHIYLNRFDYALSVSYTGKPDDLSTSHNNREYYTGAPAVSVEDIEKLRENKNIFLILDTMSLSRVSSDLVNYAKNNGTLKCSKEKNGSSIFVKKIPALNH